MKTYHQLLKAALCTGCAVVVFSASPPAAAFAQDIARDIPSRGNSTLQASVEGKVLAKSANSLSVSGKTIAITPSTTFTKSGKPATSADVEVGATVKVATKKTADGTLLAVTVEVL